MVKKFLVVFVVCLFVLSIFGGGAFAANKNKGALKSFDLLDEPQRDVATPRVVDMYRSLGYGKAVTCDDPIDPLAPIAWWSQRSIGVTWFDLQANGTVGRMMCIGADPRYRHFSWSYSGGENATTYPRSIAGNCIDTLPPGFETGQSQVTQGTLDLYPQTATMHDGGNVVAYTNYEGAPAWNQAITKDDATCSGVWTYKWDVPDYIDEIDLAGDRAAMAVVWDEATSRDYFHIVPIEIDVNTLNSYGGYVRCHFVPGVGPDSLISECYVVTQRRYAKTAGQVLAPPSSYPIPQIDQFSWVERVVESSPVSQKVAVVYGSPVCDDAGAAYGDDIFYVECTDNGQGWVTGAPWPPTPVNVTNFPCAEFTPFDPGSDRPFIDIAACYDYNDNLHIAYVSTYVPYPAGTSYYPQETFIYHWSQPTGISRVHTHETPTPGGNTCNHQNQGSISKICISAKDPDYHSGGDPDSVYMFCTWTQADTADCGASGLANRDIFGSGSTDGGKSWGAIWNLTNTKSPGCPAPDCPSEQNPSLAVNMLGGGLHIQYECDRDPGYPPWEELGTWTENEMYYLSMAEWDITAIPRGQYQLDQDNWYNPFLKVEPGKGTRSQIMKVYSIGNAPLTVSVSDDDPCVVADFGPAVVEAQDSVSVPVLFEGAGVDCEGKFYDGTMTITTNEPEGKTTETEPIQAVAAEDYYECPRDSTTVDSLDNGVLRLFVAGNCFWYANDISTEIMTDTTFESFFNAHGFVATTSGTDTLVGRYVTIEETHDKKAGTRDSLYTRQCDFAGEAPFWLLYTKNIFIHAMHEPPINQKWWWWELSKQVKFFKPEADDIYKHLIIKYVRIKRHDPPGWWPDQTPFASYENTYIGEVCDFDLPSDSMNYYGRSWKVLNKAGYDDVNHIAWQRGWNRDDIGAVEHPEYDEYYAGFALADGGFPGDSEVPYGAHNVSCHEDIHDQDGWGWLDGRLYQLAATTGHTEVHPDTVYGMDRIQVFTAKKIDAGSDANAEDHYTVIAAFAIGDPGNPGSGLTELQATIDTARAIVARDRANGIPAQCGDLNGDYLVDLGDLLYIVSYLYKGGDAPVCPIERGDVTSDGIIDLGDLLAIVSYLYKGGDEPDCPGIWF